MLSALKFNLVLNVYFQLEVVVSHWLLTLGIFVHHVFGKMVNGQSGPAQEKGNLNLIRLVLLSRLFLVFSRCIFAQ